TSRATRTPTSTRSGRWCANERLAPLRRSPARRGRGRGRAVRLRADRTVGEAVRAREPCRSDHGLRPPPGIEQLPRPRLRGARRRARRHRRRRRRLRMQLTGIAGLRAWLPALCGLLAAPAIAGVLPEDRADLLYHRYD